ASCRRTSVVRKTMSKRTWVILIACAFAVIAACVITARTSRPDDSTAVRLAPSFAPVAAPISPKLDHSPALTFRKNDPMPSDDAQAIADDLASPDAKTRAAAIEKVRRLMRTTP